MFLFKKIITPLFYPLTFCMVVMLLGLICLMMKRRQKLGKCLVAAGMALLVLFSYGPMADRLVMPLENRYPPIHAANLAPAVKGSIRWIVVLGGGCTPNPRRPATAQLSGASEARLVEAIRLHREIPGSVMLLSGGAVFDAVSEAHLMAEAARILGVDAGKTALEPVSRDTEEQAVFIRKIVGPDRFILVTSALHMPRAVALFRKAGMEPIPAPTQFLADETNSLRPGLFYPQADTLAKSGMAIYEYLGMLWSWLRGRI